MDAVVTPVIEPDADSIKAHLEALFAPARETYPRGLIELRYGRDGSLPNHAYFNLRKEGVAEAAAYAANRNREGANVYVGVNPRKPATDTKHAANATGVEIAFWHFADLDKADAVANAGKRIRALPPTMTVNTGTVPHRRPHLYWLLEEPVSNMEAWTERQRGIAQSLEGDSVIDPPRIMRLAGTVNFPTQKKLQAGYQTELTTLKQTFDEERAPVTPDEIAAAYPVRGMPNGSDLPISGQNTLQAMRRTRVQDLLDACRNGSEWHNSMVRLVAHLAATGRSSAEILALADHITLPGYTIDQTCREMAKALEGARSKWALPEPDDEPIEIEEAGREEARTLEVLDAFDFDESAIPVRPWIIPGVMLSGYTHMLVAPGGSGKSLFTLQLAITLATGAQWGAWTPKKRQKTLVINVEDDIDEQRRRLSAARHVMEPSADLLRGMIHLVTNADSIVAAKLDAATKSVVATPIVKTLREYIEANKIGVLIVDPFAETFEGDENSNSEVKWAMKVWRDEVAKPTGCAVYLVHHTTKYANGGAGDANIVRGAGAIVNSTRISATLMPMTADEAQVVGIDSEERHRYVRYDDAKANQSLLSGKARWFEKVSVQISNGGGLQEPDEVGALVPWSPPDAFDGINVSTIKMSLERIHRGIEDADGRPTGERYSRHKQAGARWAGTVIVECFGVEEKRAAMMLKTWLENKVILEKDYDDIVQRKKRSGLFVDMASVSQMGGA